MLQSPSNSMSSTGAPRPKHSLAWGEHFRRSALDQLDIPWHEANRLSDDQRRILIPSLQDFQLGESSDGRHGLARAGAYGNRVGDPYYAETMRLFFAEENRHAAYLACYLQIQDEPLIAHSWTDFVFRRVRRLMGLETLLTVLLSVELIAEVYYRAIFNATRCPTLRAICTQTFATRSGTWSFTSSASPSCAKAAGEFASRCTE
jgi:hypothetical protein